MRHLLALFTSVAALCLASGSSLPGQDQQGGGREHQPGQAEKKADTKKASTATEAKPPAVVGVSDGDGAGDPIGTGGEGTAGQPLPVAIRVEQDPMRIAPGETGTLLLYLMPSRTARIAPSGVVKLDPKEGPLRFGPARWDPPKRGAFYDHNFLIHVPVSVAAGAAFGKYEVSGTVSVSGSFRVAAGAGDPVAKAPATGPELASFLGKITVGPAIPRPGVRKPARAAAAPAPGTQPTASPADSLGDPAAADTNPPAAIRQPVSLAGDGARPRGSGLGLAEGGAAEDQAGFLETNLAWLCAGGAVLLVGLVFLLRGSSR